MRRETQHIPHDGLKRHLLHELVDELDHSPAEHRLEIPRPPVLELDEKAKGGGAETPGDHPGGPNGSQVPMHHLGQPPDVHEIRMPKVVVQYAGGDGRGGLLWGGEFELINMWLVHHMCNQTHT